MVDYTFYEPACPCGARHTGCPDYKRTRLEARDGPVKAFPVVELPAGSPAVTSEQVADALHDSP